MTAAHDDESDPKDEALLSALTTQHFVLQSAASATIGESSSRSSLYLLSLSSSLVALGFAQGIDGAFAPFAAAVLPTLFLLGWFTVVRLVDTSIQNVRCLRGIASIHQYYAGLHPRAPEFFATGSAALQAHAMTGSRPSRFSLWFTMASLIGTINGPRRQHGRADPRWRRGYAPLGCCGCRGCRRRVTCAAGVVVRAAALRCGFPDEGNA